jgi:hypothetical protein
MSNICRKARLLCLEWDIIFKKIKLTKAFMSNFSKKQLGILILFLLCIQLYSPAQDNLISKISIASPTAASLGKYGDIPVNYHTGVPQISIPIYTVTSGSLSLPISLSYHSSGLKVQEPASWVGAGWALNAGGVITRSVVGTPDERRTNNAGTAEKGHFSDYGYNNYLAGVVVEDWTPFADGRRDGEPDLFFFNFGGYSGKFYFRDDRTPVIVPEADFKIEPYYTEVSNTSIQSFIITTPDGAKYYFGNTPGLTGTAPIEITKPSTFINGLPSANVISSWYLNKIATADDKFTITLNYQPENYGYHTISMFPIDGLPTGTSFASRHGYDLVKNIIQGVRLSQILFPNGSINFIEGTNARTDLSDLSWSPNSDIVNQTVKPLGAIQINDAVNIPLKKFNFTYSYFTDNTTLLPIDIQNIAPALQTDKQRLKLNQLQEVSGDGTITKPAHSFTYFSELVARRLSFGIDHWGFSNGVTGNQTLIPTYTRFGNNSATIYPGADRDANWPAMRGGTLQKINYPTGGYSLFEFESNNVYNTNTSIVNATLADFWIHLFSQGSITNTVPLVITQYNPIDIAISNTSNYGATFTITNSSNVVVYNTPISNNNPNFQNTMTLPQGTYQATISLPPASNITGGTSVIIKQIQSVQTTNTVAVGGNRIKTITNNDGATANNIVTSYTYTQDNPLLSSAILYSRPVYVGIVRNDIIRDVGYFDATGAIVPNPFNIYGCPVTPEASYYQSPSSIRPMATTQGNHVGYAQVKVAQTGNGYTLYKYYGATGVPSWLANPGDIAVRILNNAGCDGNAPNYPPAPLPFDFMRGELKYEAQYNEAGLLLKESNYTPVYEESTIKTPAFIVVRSGANNQMLGTKYQIGTSKKISDAVIEKMYNSADANFYTTTTTTYYESPFHHQPTRVAATNSKGEVLETKKKYAFDMRLSACDAIADGYPQYSNTYSSCYGTYITAKFNCGSNNGQCQGDAYLNFITCATNARISYVNYRRTNFTNPVNTFKTNHDYAKNNTADAELKPVLEMQDKYQNPVLEITKWRNSNLLSASFNRYDYITNPAGYVYPQRSQKINIQSPSATFTNASVSGNTIVKDSRYEDESLVKFDNGNIVEVKGRDGIYTAYIWGYTNTLPVAEATGVTYAILKAAFDAAGGDLNLMRNQATLSKAFVTTYFYTPAVGIIKKTAPNNKSTFYEYDSFQRLKYIRDQDNNIVKKFCYNYAGQVENCAN